MASRKCANCKKWLAAGQYTCRYCNRGEQDLRGDVKTANAAKLRACFAGTERLDEAALVLLLAPWAAGEALPETLCGETVAWGQSSLLVDAVVKKGCVGVSDACLGQLVAATKRKEEEASELERQVAQEAEVVRRKVLAGVDVAEREKEQLAGLRSRVAELRDTAFLRHVLETCRVEEGAALLEARALLQRACERLKEDPKAEVVLATPAQEKETFQQTQERVGVNEEVQALRERDLESSQDELDEWCGEEAAEEAVTAGVAEVMVEDAVVKVSGSLVPFVKGASLTFQSLAKTQVEQKLKKMGGVYSAKMQEAADLRLPLRVELSVCWFPKLMFQEYAVERVAVTVESSTFGLPTRIAFAAPFKKPRNLVHECIEVLHSPSSGSAVKHELLKGRLEGAMERLLDGGDAAKQWRHLCTLFCAHRCFSRMLHLEQGYARSRQVYDVIFVSPNSRALGVADFFLSRLDSFVRPGLNLGALKSRLWVGFPFSHEFDRAVAAEYLNANVTAPGSRVLVEHMRTVLQSMCDTFVSPFIGECMHPLVAGVAVKKVGINTQVVKLSQHEALLVHCVEQAVRGLWVGAPLSLTAPFLFSPQDFSRTLQLLAFCMGRHRRLGEESCVRWLPKDLMKLIGGLVVRDDSSTDCVTLTYRGTKTEKPRSVAMRTGLTTVASTGLRQEQRAVMHPPRAVYLTASLDSVYWFPRFLELPDRALQRVAAHLPVPDVCRLELSCKALMLRLAQVYAYQFCCPGMWLPPGPRDLASEEGRIEWNRQCKDKALKMARIRTQPLFTGLTYPYLKDEALRETVDMPKSFCLQQ